MAVADTKKEGGGRTLVTLRNAACLGPFTSAQIGDYIRRGVLLEHVHYTRPHGTWPLIVKEAYLAWLEGEDAELRRRRPRMRGKCNLAVLEESA